MATEEIVRAVAAGAAKRTGATLAEDWFERAFPDGVPKNPTLQLDGIEQALIEGGGRSSRELRREAAAKAKP